MAKHYARALLEPGQLLSYEVPLRPGLRAELTLPCDLTAEEAERIAGVVRALAFEDEGG